MTDSNLYVLTVQLGLIAAGTEYITRRTEYRVLIQTWCKAPATMWLDREFNEYRACFPVSKNCSCQKASVDELPLGTVAS